MKPLNEPWGSKTLGKSVQSLDVWCFFPIKCHVTRVWPSPFRVRRYNTFSYFLSTPDSKLSESRYQYITKHMFLYVPNTHYTPPHHYHHHHTFVFNPTDHYFYLPSLTIIVFTRSLPLFIYNIVKYLRYSLSLLFSVFHVCFHF